MGICYGMQLAVVEYARNVAGMQDAHTTEVNPNTPYPVIDLLPIQKQYLQDHNMGGTMRLGAYDASVKAGSIVSALYGNVACIAERHRHRYEVNPVYVKQLEAAGLIFSGYHERADGTRLMEFIELADHPFFVATQAHPEFKSRFGFANPTYTGFIKAAIAYQQRTDKKNANKDQWLCKEIVSKQIEL